MARSKQWSEIYDQLSKADTEKPLEPKERETLATAAYLIGKDAESVDTLTQAHQSYLDEKNFERAVRCAFWLGMILINSGDRARGGGWIARGERLINDHELDCSEKGFFLSHRHWALSPEEMPPMHNPCLNKL